MAETEKERSTDLLEAADFCEEMARQLVINFRMNKIPVIKFMSYLTGHIYFMLFLTLTSVVPPHPTVRDSLLPYWYEVVSIAWYGGLLLAQLTNPGAKGGLSWVKPLIVFL